MGATRSITLTVSVDDDDPATTSDLMALADVVSEAASTLIPGSTTRLVVRTSAGAPVPDLQQAPRGPRAPRNPRARTRRGGERAA